MKFLPLIVFFVAVLSPAAALSTEDSDGTAVDTAEATDSYLDEIKAACQQESAGLDNADEYMKSCIEQMKASFPK